jgi:hypothetical protein
MAQHGGNRAVHDMSRRWRRRPIENLTMGGDETSSFYPLANTMRAVEACTMLGNEALVLHRVVSHGRPVQWECSIGIKG